MFKNIFLAFRPKTLSAALVPCMAGGAMSEALLASFSWFYFFCALVSALFIQIGTNLVNDAMDFKKGADKEDRIGPVRITQSGVLSFKTVMLMGGVFFFLALLLGIPLVLKAGWPLVILGLVSIMLGYAYTSGPFPLAYTGLGDIFVIFFFGIFAVLGLVFVMTGQWVFSAAILGTQIGLLATSLIAINNLRDHEGDARAKKNTLAVRFGVNFVRWEILVLLLLPFVIGLYWIKQGIWMVGVLPLVLVPLAWNLAFDIKMSEISPVFNLFLARAAKLHLLFGFLMTASFLFHR